MSTTLVVKILPSDRSNPAGKLADAELHFSGGDLWASSPQTRL